MVKSKIIDIGELVPAFQEERLLILFGPQATEELQSICAIHEFEEQPNNILQVGTQIKISNQTYTITKVGEAANQNFNELGYVSIYFRTGENEILPGAIIVEPDTYPDMKIGDNISFIST